jgi:hypothetical protein
MYSVLLGELFALLAHPLCNCVLLLGRYQAVSASSIQQPMTAAQDQATAMTLISMQNIKQRGWRFSSKRGICYTTAGLSYIYDSLSSWNPFISEGNPRRYCLHVYTWTSKLLYIGSPVSTKSTALPRFAFLTIHKALIRERTAAKKDNNYALFFGRRSFSASSDPRSDTFPRLFQYHSE